MEARGDELKITVCHSYLMYRRLKNSQIPRATTGHSMMMTTEGTGTETILNTAAPCRLQPT